MIEGINSGGKYCIGVFAYLAIKGRVVYCRLRLLIELRLGTAVKKHGGNRDGLAGFPVGEHLSNFVGLVLHGVTLPSIFGCVHRFFRTATLEATREPYQCKPAA